MTGRSCFVTGAYGLVGAWLVRALLEDGAQVIVLRRDVAPHSPLVLLGLEPEVAVVNGDVCDGPLLERAIGEWAADTVFHLAAQTIVGIANRSPAGTFETNIRGTWNLLEASRRHEVPRVVVAASDKAYGAHDELPYREDFALQPRFPYDVSKAATDLIARSYWHAFGVSVAVTRFANVYGGGDQNGSRLIPEAIGAALAGRRPVIRSDGSPERDFLYVEDAARAYVAVADALDNEGAAGEAFNAGGGEPHSVREVVDLVCRLISPGLEPDIRGDGTPAGEIDRQYVDFSKLHDLTGWAPRVALEDGLRRTVEWHREHPQALPAHPATS
jgi:CDP-glucose 4,6-dehydratase